jgi:hypothetical protein
MNLALSRRKQGFESPRERQGEYSIPVVVLGSFWGITVGLSDYSMACIISIHALGRAGQREAVQQTRLPTSTVEPHISPAPRDNATNRSEIVQAALWLTQTAQTYLPPALRSTLPQLEPSNERPSIHYGAMPIKLPSRRSRGLTLTTTNGFILSC